MSRPLIYLVKKSDDHFSYQFIGERISLLDLNKNESLKKYPSLGNNDYEMLKNAGGTIIYSENITEIFVWLVNVNHNQMEFFKESPLSEKIESIINTIKRDITLNKIL